MAASSIATLCLWSDVEAVYSVVGSDLSISDLGGDEEDAKIDVLERGSWELQRAIVPRIYSEAEITETVNGVVVGKKPIRLDAAILATERLCSRRGNSPPAQITQDANDVREYLKQVSNGHLQYPGIARSYYAVPMFANLRVDFSRQERMGGSPIRVDQSRSSEHLSDSTLRRYESRYYG